MPHDPVPPPAKPIAVVGIGASAGGLAALKTFFSEVPSDTGIAFVVVVHLSPDHESHLANVLQPHARLPVEQVSATVPLAPDHIYLIPPNANLDAIDTHLRLSQLEESRRERAPIDHFFRTLAEAHDGHAVGIVLSGTGSDGALGIKAIKEKGGLAIAQDPSDAEYDGMPQSAIATGAVDLVLPLGKILPAVLRFAHTEPHIATSDDGDEVADDARVLLMNLFAQIRTRTGRDFTRYKRSTLLRRIARRMQLQQIEELSDYVQTLRDSPDEIRALADDFLITVTNFFRDPLVYEKLEQEILPKLFTRNASNDLDVRVWSVGCATGEEAYSLAMLCLEEAARHTPVPRVQVFASDLHEHSLERARQAFYPGDIHVDVPPERLRRFFVKEDGGYRVRKEVRDVVVFAQHNLLSDPPFSRLDLISCRNLLIYLERDAQLEVDELFHYALRSDGVLVVGGSESIVRPELFLAEDKKACIYRKRDVPTPEPRLPVFPTWRVRTRDRRPLPDVDQRHASYGDLHYRILERYGPPTLLVGPDDKVVNLSGDAGRYMQHPSGELTASAFKLVREELRLELRAAVPEARRSGAEVCTRLIRLQLEGEERCVVLRVRPSNVPQDLGFVLVLFEERDPELETSAAGSAGASRAAQDRPGHELESELDLMRHQLQSIVEEYETSQEEMRASNEELQSANEELRSTLEELETSKEELHSMNEELQTANQENRHKVEELAQLSGDLQNLLTATDIATLFLDRDLRIMRFTPKVRELFNVRVTDRGRPLSDLTHRLGYDDLHHDAATVLARLVPIERDVRDDAGRWYFTRLLPYRSTTDRIDGVVLTFVDVSALKQVEGALRESEERVSDELAAMLRLHALVSRLLVCPDLATALAEVLDATLALTHAQMGNVQLLGADGVLRIATQRGLSDAFCEHFAEVRVGDGAVCGRALELRRRVIVHDVATDPAYTTHREVAAAAGYRGVQSTPLISRDGDVLGVLSTLFAKPYHPSERDLRVLDLYAHQAAEFIERVRSIEELNQKTHLLQEEDERKRFFLAALGHELRNPLAALDGAMHVIEQGIRSAPELQPLMSAQVEQLKRLVNDLLEISRITRGTIALRRANMDLVPLLHRVAESLQGSLRAKEQRLVLPSAKSLVLHADEVRLEQVLSNVLANASKYSPERTRIEISLQREGETVVIGVRDEGRGLRAEDLRRIFEPFEQAEPRGGGLGIGLALARHMVELHGGSVEAASEGSGRGSVFTIRLPVGEVDGAAVAAHAAAPARDFPAGTRVLVVDDQRDNAETLGLLLEALGAEVRCAHTGADAVEQARAWRPHVALVDIGLPDMTGYAVAEQIREALGEQVLLLAVTGFGDPAAGEQSRQAGFAERLVKPLDHERLHTLITRHLQQPRT